jgi:hypothetical protein
MIGYEEFERQAAALSQVKTEKRTKILLFIV